LDKKNRRLDARVVFIDNAGELFEEPARLVIQ